jgi:hypothetical protein
MSGYGWRLSTGFARKSQASPIGGKKAGGYTVTLKRKGKGTNK